MIGAIAGDIIGSVYEGRPIKTKSFPLFSDHSTFTDDTVLTVAVAEAILHHRDYAHAIREFARKYPNAGYGMSFYNWMMSPETAPYNSWGNGAAMRVSPVGYLFHTQREVLNQARLSAAVTHNHPEGIKGAQATALAVFLARTGRGKADIRAEISTRFGYRMDRTIAGIRPGYRFDVSCQGSVPEAIIAFLDSTDYEDAVRNAVSLGGDSDTQACIAGAIAEAFHGGVPDVINREARERLPDEFLSIIDELALKSND